MTYGKNIEMEIFIGSRIDQACKAAIAACNEHDLPVRFVFNGTEVVVRPGDLSNDVEKRWLHDFRKQHQGNTLRETQVDEFDKLRTAQDTTVRIPCYLPEGEFLAGPVSPEIEEFAREFQRAIDEEIRRQEG